MTCFTSGLVRKVPRSVKAKFIRSVRPPEPVLPEAEAVKAGSVPPAGSDISAQLPPTHTMDSLPATVPAVTASPGDPELLGPLSVLYAALIAKLLEVTVPSPREGPRQWQAGGPGLGRASVPERRAGPEAALWSPALFSESTATVTGDVLRGGVLSLRQCLGVGPIL